MLWKSYDHVTQKLWTLPCPQLVPLYRQMSWDVGRQHLGSFERGRCAATFGANSHCSSNLQLSALVLGE